MTFRRPTLRTTALLVTRGVLASAFLCVAATAACSSDDDDDDSPGTQTPTAPTGVATSFSEAEVSVSASPTLTGPEGTAKSVTWKPRAFGTHMFKPAAGERQNRLQVDITLDGEGEVYFLHAIFDVTSVPASLPVTHTTSGIVSTTVPPPGGILASFSGANFNTPGQGDIDSTGASGAMSLESYTVTGTTEADVKLTTSMKFDKLTLKTNAGDFVMDGTLAFSAANEGSGGTSDAGGGGGGGCIVGAWKAPSCGGAKQIILDLPASGKGSLTNPDCNGVCTPLVFLFDYTSTATSITLSYTSAKPITCSGSTTTPAKPTTNDTMTYTCSGNTLTTTTSKGSMTYTK